MTPTWKNVACASCCCPGALFFSPSGAALFSVSAPRLHLHFPPPKTFNKIGKQRKKKEKKRESSDRWQAIWKILDSRCLKKDFQARARLAELFTHWSGIKQRMSCWKHNCITLCNNGCWGSNLGIYTQRPLCCHFCLVLRNSWCIQDKWILQNSPKTMRKWKVWGFPAASTDMRWHVYGWKRRKGWLSKNDKLTPPTSGLAWSACLWVAAEASEWNPAHLTPLQTEWSRSTVLDPVAWGLKHKHTQSYEGDLWLSEICVEQSLTCSPDTYSSRWISLKHRLVPFSKNGVHNLSFWICNHTLYFIHWRTPWICLEESKKRT